MTMSKKEKVSLVSVAFVLFSIILLGGNPDDN